MIFTKCDNCVFATMTNNKQSGCNLNKADMLGIEEINENGYYDLQRFCNTYRPEEWLSELSVTESEDLSSTVMAEVFPRVGVFVILDTNDEDLTKLRCTLDDVTNQTEGVF